MSVNNNRVQSPSVPMINVTFNKATISSADEKVSKVAKGFFAQIGACIAAPFKFIARVIKSGFMALINLCKRENKNEEKSLNDQATLKLKDALVLQDAGAFADLASQQTAEEIRTWFSNPINHPLLQNVIELNLRGRGLSLIPSELRFLSNLRSLYLDRNQIISIAPEAFANLPNLQRLLLTNNQIPEPERINNAYLGLGPHAVVHVDVEIPLSIFSCSIL